MAHNSLLNVFNALNQNSVSYLVVGGTAVSYYGRYRPSINDKGQVVEKPDLDIWYDPTYANYYNLLKALAELGQDVARYWDETTPDPKNSFFRYEFDDYTLDMLPTLYASLNFSTCFGRRTSVIAAGVEIAFISFEDLLQDKQALSKPKDLLDIQNLTGNDPSPVS